MVDGEKARPTVPEVLPLVNAIYQREGGSVGCRLHIITDDGNVSHGDAMSCLETARERGHPDCTEALELMVQMSSTQRARLAALHV